MLNFFSAEAPFPNILNPPTRFLPPHSDICYPPLLFFKIQSLIPLNLASKKDCSSKTKLAKGLHSPP